jgi:hypothetical protein
MKNVIGGSCYVYTCLSVYFLRGLLLNNPPAQRSGGRVVSWANARRNGCRFKVWKEAFSRLLAMAVFEVLLRGGVLPKLRALLQRVGNTWR